MTRVMASGVFDILHPGHIHYLTEAKAMGDELVVVVASDKTVEQNKRKPIMDQQSRMLMISALSVVDKVVPGGEGDMYDTVKDIMPDLLVLGYDQTFDEANLEEELLGRGIDAKVVRASPRTGDLNGTRKIIGRIIWLKFDCLR